jgi:hypothetical protein
MIHGESSTSARALYIALHAPRAALHLPYAQLLGLYRQGRAVVPRTEPIGREWGPRQREQWDRPPHPSAPAPSHCVRVSRYESFRLSMPHLLVTLSGCASGVLPLARSISVGGPLEALRWSSARIQGC